ncbi:YkyA family protein [Aquibacillus kalidii]|uniref:YkyA family protein n=1 Tax=Aquibacillus kalidii TaxID=2762597 RepID=UPI002E2C525C|nr:YkyA family protein [Aquibacillus kalidii]
MQHINKLAIVMIFVVLLLGACSGPSAPEQMYEHMEEAVSLEKKFAEQQKPLVELEKEEKQLYDQIIDLSMEEFEKVKELSQKALTTIEKRKEILDKEKASIEEAKTEFDKIKPLIEDLENEKVTSKANELKQAMDDRYAAYLELNKAYSNSLKEDKKLYELFQKEDLEEQELKDQIKVINEQYDKVIKTNEIFNDKTDLYNDLKGEFYKLAEINVEYDE